MANFGNLAYEAGATPPVLLGLRFAVAAALLSVVLLAQPKLRDLNAAPQPPSLGLALPRVILIAVGLGAIGYLLQSTFSSRSAPGRRFSTWAPRWRVTYSSRRAAGYLSPSAMSANALACTSAESTTGRGESSGPTSRPISVQASTTASAPRASRSRITAR